MRREQQRYVDDVDYVPVNVAALLEDEDQVARLAEAAVTEPAATLIRVALLMLDEERAANERSPKQNDVDIRKNVSYRLGVIHGLKCIASLPRSAHDALK